MIHNTVSHCASQHSVALCFTYADLTYLRITFVSGGLKTQCHTVFLIRRSDQSEDHRRQRRMRNTVSHCAEVSVILTVYMYIYMYIYIQINEHNIANMFIFIRIYFTNVFEDNHIFLYRCLHRNIATSRTIIEKITNRISFNKYNIQLT